MVPVSSEKQLTPDPDSIFTKPDFDAVTFLNSSLPPLSVSTNFQADHGRGKAASLQDAAAQTQNLLTNLNTRNIREASSLSQLTDDILRSGSRLAYEVEVLRGDANSLNESLTETLLENTREFTAAEKSKGENTSSDPVQSHADLRESDPEFIRQLRMLGQVKARLEEVVKVFGNAMEWPLAPSEVSITSSLISVSAPETGSASHSREEKGKEFAKKTRAEIIKLLSNSGTENGMEAALQKVEELRLLSTVWKGTAEERARTKFVDSLSKAVTDRRQAGIRTQSQETQRANSAILRPGPTAGRQSSERARDNAGGEGGSGAGGLFRNLQRLRDEIYLE